MRKFIYESLFLALLGIGVFGFVSCEKTEYIEEIESNKKMSLDAFFQKVHNMNLDINENDVLYIDYEWDAVNKTISVTKTEALEPDFFIIEEKAIGNGTTYKVTCKTENGSWTKTCDGKWSCGNLIYKCLKSDGCATICSATMAYHRPTASFYLGVQPNSNY